MDKSATNETIGNVIELLSLLTSPLVHDNETLVNEVTEFDDALRLKLLSLTNSASYKHLKEIHDPEDTWKIGYSKTQIRWDFVRTCLHLLEFLRNTIFQIDDEKSKLLSVAQKKILETAFQFVVSLALLPYLLPGVGVSLERKCRHFNRVKVEELTEFAKHRRLCYTMDALLSLRSVDVFHEIMVSKHLEDILAALFQLSFVPFKKPVSDNSEEATILDAESLDDNYYETNKMTYSLWVKLESDKKRFRGHLEKLQSQLYRPLIIRNHMILLGSKEIPRWMRQNLITMLTRLVLEENGVTAIIKGIIEMNHESPTLSSHCATVAKLIASIFCNENESKIKSFSSQLEKILSNDSRQAYDYVYVNVIAAAIKEMLQNNPKRTEEYLLDAILNPLRNVVDCSEEEINKSIIQMHNLCIVPSNDTVAVPIQVIVPVSSVLCFMHTQIKDSVCYLKSPIRELLEKLFLKANRDTLARLLDVAIFDERTWPDIVRVPTGKKISFSSNGGIRVVNSDVNFTELENGITVLHLMKGIQGNDALISSLFIYLLKKYVDPRSEGNYALKRVVIVFLLTQLTQDSDTLRHVLKNAENIIQFVRELLNAHVVEDDQNADVIRVCLTFLTMVLYDVRFKKDVNWQIFNSLLPSIKKLKNSGQPDIMFLAEEVHNLIATRNVIGGTTSVNVADSNSLIQEIPRSPCEKAIEDACDPLLPVRAHALMELIALIKKGDAETLSKKEKIFCLFQENLKDKDSFLYLRAIEGLASLALLRPDDVLPLLCQEFNLCSSAETRLKIGEILTRTVKLLNDFVLPHKRLLVNTFVNGVKDENCLVRTSSLSNLGEVCLALRSNVGDILQEVIQCAQAVALFDENEEPRRAAVFLITSLFRGLKTTVFEVLESSLLELYRTLKRICANDVDEVVRVQTETSLNILNEIMKESFTGRPIMEKKIRILN